MGDLVKTDIEGGIHRITLNRPEQRALDDFVFDLVGLTPAEREAARVALLDSLSGRRLRARVPAATKEG